jgi:ribosomal protein L40E
MVGLLATLVSAAQVESFTVGPLQRYSLIMNLDAGDRVWGSVSVSGGSGNDIDFRVTDPVGAVIRNYGRVRYGASFDFTASREGAYTLIFDNTFSIFSSKQISVTYNVEAPFIPPITGAGGSSTWLVLILALVIIIVAVAAVESGKERRKAAVTTTPEVTARIYCSKCGAENSADAAFCRSCGAKIMRSEGI